MQVPSRSSGGDSFCWLLVIIDQGGLGVVKTYLEKKLGCDIASYCCVQDEGNPLFKVKVNRRDVCVALRIGRKSGCIVDLWHSSAGIARTPLDTAPSMDVKPCEGVRKQIHVTAWNCRGWSVSAPYIRSLLDGDYGILVLSELMAF